MLSPNVRANTAACGTKVVLYPDSNKDSSFKHLDEMLFLFIRTLESDNETSNFILAPKNNVHRIYSYIVHGGICGHV